MQSNSPSSMPVLNHGYVDLANTLGGDLSVVNAARVSFMQHTNIMRESDEKLISYLMRNKHGTPFEHNIFTFVVKAPIFVFREWHRHRVGISINEVSARYTELPAEWYIPRFEHVRTRVGKPGAYTYEPVHVDLALSFCNMLAHYCFESFGHYKAYLEAGVAPEQARMFLHVNHYSEMYWTCNARSLMHFLELRNKPDAQWEIQQYAKALEHFFFHTMPTTAQAFIDNGRIAP